MSKLLNFKATYCIKGKKHSLSLQSQNFKGATIEAIGVVLAHIPADKWDSEDVIVPEISISKTRK